MPSDCLSSPCHLTSLPTIHLLLLCSSALQAYIPAHFYLFPIRLSNVLFTKCPSVFAHLPVDCLWSPAFSPAPCLDKSAFFVSLLGCSKDSLLSLPAWALSPAFGPKPTFTKSWQICKFTNLTTVIHYYSSVRIEAGFCCIKPELSAITVITTKYPDAFKAEKSDCWNTALCPDRCWMWVYYHAHRKQLACIQIIIRYQLNWKSGQFQ